MRSANSFQGFIPFQFRFNVSNLKTLIFILCLINPIVSSAQHIIKIDDGVDELNLMPYEVMYYKDKSDSLTFEQISSSRLTDKFEQHTNYQNQDFVANAAYWVRLPIRHSAHSKKLWLLEFYDQTIDNLEAYIPQDDGTYQSIKLGDDQPFVNRAIPHKNYELLLQMKKDTVMYYYFKIRSHEFVDIRIALRSTNRFVYYALKEYFLFGMFYGMIIIISLYNFLTYLVMREIKFIYYIFYILSVALYAMSLDGIGFQYLWQNHPGINRYATGASLYLVIVWSLLFTCKFLDTKNNAPILNRLLVLLIIARTILFATALFVFPILLSQRIIDIIPLSVIFYVSIYVWNNGYRPARFFVMAYGILFFGFFLRTLVYFNILPLTTISHYSLHFSFVLEMLFLTLALGDRIRILKDNRDNALRAIIHQNEVNIDLKERVNRELEQKVEERTKELHLKNNLLEESNAKLLRQANEINKINSILDLDNWKLKNRVKEVLNEMLQEKAMDYSEFKLLYPNEITCYRFLEELKWAGGFHCQKCKNEKFFVGNQKFSKRCTKCGYNESITAFTIFHGIKFPIEKAFFIAYLSVVGKKESTLESISKQLEIGLNTTWAFRSKVILRIKEMEEAGKMPTSARWQEVIITPKRSVQATVSKRTK